MQPRVRFRADSLAAAGAVPIHALGLRRSVSWPVGQAEAEFPPGAKLPPVGDAVTIEATSDGTDLAAIFTGTVLRRQVGAWGARVQVEEATGPLTRVYHDKVIPTGAAAQIISDLCRAANVKCTAKATGPTLTGKLLLSNRSAMEQILDLARLSGLRVLTTVKGELLVATPAPLPGQAVVKLGANVVDYRLEAAPEIAGDLTVSGDGAAGAQGAEAKVWLAQSLTAVSAGNAVPQMHLPALKSQADAARTHDAEVLRRKQARTRATIILAGAPPADLGEGITLSGFPEGPASVWVAAIDVWWEAGQGLLTRLELRGGGGT